MEYTILSWAPINLKFYWHTQLVCESICLKIKSNLQGITKISDLNKATKYLVKSSDLETRVTSIVNKLLVNFEKTIEEKYEAKIGAVQIIFIAWKPLCLMMEDDNLKTHSIIQPQNFVVV